MSTLPLEKCTETHVRPAIDRVSRVHFALKLSLELSVSLRVAIGLEPLISLKVSAILPSSPTQLPGRRTGEIVDFHTLQGTRRAVRSVGGLAPKTAVKANRR
jgi:hypothetical protein